MRSNFHHFVHTLHSMCCVVFFSPNQLSETKAESEELVRQCAGEVAARVERLVRALQQAGREQVGTLDTHALCKDATFFSADQYSGARIECSIFLHSTLSHAFLRAQL